MKFINNLKGLIPIYDAYSKKHIYNFPNIGNKLEYSLCYKLNDDERRRIPNKTAGIYFLGLNFTTSNLDPSFSPAYVGSSVDIRDRLRDYTIILRGNNKVLNKSYELALEHIPQQYWTFVWTACPDYQDVEKYLIKTLCTFNGVYLLKINLQEVILMEASHSKCGKDSILIFKSL
ncbi:hypothetical protein [Ureibacillus thermophilus]|uniref:GIY-YIG domain-containing protein n=1 Tax=Ureibacillus thermophilus TaxID=367743 RepID=A0A4P6UUP4_9BACL|nr:hypothetical protein [Ureibacillus thermophilus]QBK25292.1 hypothetical protein DKZ56_05120 [Ureibacillus thermophilus]